MAGLYLNHVKVAEESGGIVSLPNTVQFNNLKIGGTEVINSNRQIQNITGIDFSPSSGTGTPSSNLLDDYEEGTWTPTLPSASTATISNIYGNARYTKIGNIVHAYFNIKIGTNSDSNLLRVSLPFSSTNTQTGTTATEGVAILMYSTSTAARGNVYSAQNISTFQDANFTNRTYADASDTFLYAYVVYQSA